MSAYLLDTHVIIWLLTQPEKLTLQAQAIILNPQNKLYYSVASLWEMAIKSSLGKLRFHQNWLAFFEQELAGNDIQALAITRQDLEIVEQLPFYHRDPFDRLLIAQAKSNHLTLLTADQNCTQYPIATTW